MVLRDRHIGAGRTVAASCLANHRLSASFCRPFYRRFGSRYRRRRIHLTGPFLLPLHFWPKKNQKKNNLREIDSWGVNLLSGRRVAQTTGFPLKRRRLSRYANKTIDGGALSWMAWSKRLGGGGGLFLAAPAISELSTNQVSTYFTELDPVRRHWQRDSIEMLSASSITVSIIGRANVFFGSDPNLKWRCLFRFPHEIESNRCFVLLSTWFGADELPFASNQVKKKREKVVRFILFRGARLEIFSSFFLPLGVFSSSFFRVRLGPLEVEWWWWFPLVSAGQPVENAPTIFLFLSFSCYILFYIFLHFILPDLLRGGGDECGLFLYSVLFFLALRGGPIKVPPPCCEPSSADIFFFAGFFRFYLSGSSQFYYYCYHEFRRNVSYSFLFSVCVFLFELPFIIYIGSDRRLSRWRVRVDWCFSLIRSSFSTILPLRLVFF